MLSFFTKKSKEKKVLTFEKLFGNMVKIPEMVGNKSSGMKINLIFELFTIAEGVEVKFIVRFL